MKNIIFLAFFVLIDFSVIAADNVTMTSLYSITNLTAYSSSQVNESYSHTYTPNNNIKSGVDDYFNLKSQGNGMTRAHNIISVDSKGNAYVSSYAGYNTSLDANSYMTTGERVGFQTCCSVDFCNKNISRFSTSSAMGYSAKLHNGFVEQSMIVNPGPYPSANYRTYSIANGLGNELSSGVSFSSSTSSGSLSQSYEKHINVTGQFSVYSTAETQ